MKKFKLNGILIIIITIIILIFVLKDDFSNVVKSFLGLNYFWVLLAFVIVLANYIIKTLIMYSIFKGSNQKYSLIKTFKLIMILQFFNGITPFSTGGQPMIAYILKKDGVPLSVSTNILLHEYIANKLALITFDIAAIVINIIFDIIPVDSTMGGFLTIGFCINLLAAVISLSTMFASKFNKKALSIVITFLVRIKLTNNYDLIYEKFAKKIDSFYDNSKILRKNKRLLFKCYCLSLVALLSVYIIPLIITLGMGNHSLNFLNTFISSTYANLIGTFVPVPGASGGIEVAFMNFFGKFINGSMLSVLLIIWRFITYYFALICGAVIFVYGETKKALIEKEGKI